MSISDKREIKEVVVISCHMEKDKLCSLYLVHKQYRVHIIKLMMKLHTLHLAFRPYISLERQSPKTPFFYSF